MSFSLGLYLIGFRHCWVWYWSSSDDVFLATLYFSYCCKQNLTSIGVWSRQENRENVEIQFAKYIYPAFWSGKCSHLKKTIRFQQLGFLIEFVIHRLLMQQKWARSEKAVKRTWPMRKCVFISSLLACAFRTIRSTILITLLSLKKAKASVKLCI